MSEKPATHEPTRLSLDMAARIVELDAGYRGEATPELLTLLGTTADSLQKEILAVPEPDSSERSMMASSQALQEIGLALERLLKTMQKFAKGNPGSTEFETYARANRSYKSWLAATNVLSAHVQKQEVTNMGARILARNVIAPVALVRMKVQLYGGATASGDLVDVD